ncbi:hypothetical protein E7V67_027400 [[Empedobacter] haloabium]|uniref:Uncharacterized protein n=1 Tax=[Empedobacter] haloabium TaxID=592317 RepID=A0ABZ1UMS9_9BURK
MKVFHFGLDKRQVDLLFSPLRTKVDVIRLLMNTIKIMLVGDKLPTERTAGMLTLRVSSMNRLIFSAVDKIFSISFPFTTLQQEDCLRFESDYCDDIDHRITSEILALVNSRHYTDFTDIFGFADAVIEAGEDHEDLWGLVRELMMFEDNYLRYDHDPIRADGKRHPLHHLDISYTSSGTFKLGLAGRVTPEVFVDILDVESDCHFLDTKCGDFR